jgi:hypothetical protein
MTVYLMISVHKYRINTEYKWFWPTLSMDHTIYIEYSHKPLSDLYQGLL